MKKLMISFVTLLIVTISSNAQTNAEEVRFLQTIFGMEKQALVESFINPAAENKDAFWEVYNKYETERKELGRKRIGLLNKYIQVYGKASSQETHELVKEMVSLAKSNAKIINKYYKKIKKINEDNAASFFQIESYIAAKIRVDILESIPFFGEFE